MCLKSHVCYASSSVVNYNDEVIKSDNGRNNGENNHKLEQNLIENMYNII